MSEGDRGPAVRELQTRLEQLRFWVGPVDGVFGHLTEQAVYAFQKANGLAIDGIAGPAVRRALEAPAPLHAETSEGVVWEVDKGRQLLRLVRGGTVTWVWNTSTGTELAYTHDGRELIADTPVGRYDIEWQVDGWRNGSLGPLYRPKYFHHDGLAIHGYGRVPPYPASHGCVRVTLPTMNFIWATGLAPVGATVVVHGTTPRA